MATPEAKIFAAAADKPRRWPYILSAVVAGLLVVLIQRLMQDKEPPRKIEPPAKVTEVAPPTVPVETTKPPEPEPVTDRRAIINASNGQLLFYFPLTSSLKDQSPHALEAVSNGAIEVRDGAAHFPGDAYLTLPHIPLDNRPFSFAVWIKPEGKIVGYGLLEQSGGGPGKLLHLLMRDPDKPYFGCYMNDLRGPKAVEPDVWTHLVFQFTGTHQQIWVNGALVAERPAEPFWGDTGETVIGKAPIWNNVATRAFTGEMKDVRLYGAILSPQQIRILAGLDPGDPTQKKGNEVF